MATGTPQPIIILGIAQRSGTNFLLDLLALHPDSAPARVAEDFLVAYSDDLVRYTARVTKRWLAEWGSGDQLMRAIGAGMLAEWAAGLAPKRALFKTPSVENLRNVFRLFPGARVLVIVRDGRAVAESSVKSFKMDAEVVARRWSVAAVEIARFENECRQAGNPLLIVRYENLVSDLRAELTRALEHCGLDPEKFDFARAANLPVRGSGTMKTESGQVHWKQTEKKADFKPLERFASWTPDRHDRFRWLAAPGMQALGYEMKPLSAPEGRWRLVNRWTDFRQLPFPRLRRKVRALLEAMRT